MTIETAGTYRAQWGEGPIWWEECLYYVDIEGRRVLRYDPRNGEERSWEVGQRVGTVVPRLEGGLVIAGDDGFWFLDESTGSLTLIADPEPDKADNRFNDGKCSPDGRFFAGTISLVKKEGDAALYCLDQDGSVTTAYAGVTNSNGIVWSLDGRTVFYIDTPRREVLAFDYDRARGGLSDERVAFSTAGAVDASPDGMAIDGEGNLWIAFCHGFCVVCFDPSGKELRRVELPCREVTAVAFGGEDLADLYVTTGVPKEDVEEDAGRLFVVKGLGTKGVPAFGFRG
jgi:sugar lactone lactonase YvrE